MDSLGIDPSMTSTNGSISPRSPLKNHSMKLSAPWTGPHSKSISGQWTATLGNPGSTLSAISSMLGWVAAVSDTESPSQLRPALIQRMWIGDSSSADGFPFAAAWSATLEAAMGMSPRQICSESAHFKTSIHLGNTDQERRGGHKGPLR